MKTSSVIATLWLLASQASAHYIFEYLTVPTGGTEGPAYQYIRQNTNYNSPVIDLTSNDLRCNVGATGTGTATVTVAAGTSVTFTLDTPVYHDGATSVYMAKAPTTAAAYDGSGTSWFKIFEWGPDFSTGTPVWPLYGSYSATIPSALPSGDYLLRMEQLAVHNPYPAGIPQFYIECAQLTVTNGGSGVPGPLVAIPGYITGTEPGYVVNIYNNLTNYTIPGPAVWVPSSSSSGSKTTSTAKGVTTSTKAATTLKTSTKASTTSSSPASTGTGSALLYGQCGGIGWTGPTVCAAGTCTYSSAYYSQCL